MNIKRLKLTVFLVLSILGHIKCEIIGSSNYNEAIDDFKNLLEQLKGPKDEGRRLRCDPDNIGFELISEYVIFFNFSIV